MTGGVYCIENKINNNLYIGEAKNLEKRKYEHFRTLRKNVPKSFCKKQYVWENNVRR